MTVINTHYLLRFDDVVPQMAWSKFKIFEDLATEYSLPFLVGVVPDCRDPRLNVEPERSDFWQWLRERKAAGWTIAQHGYQHIYDTPSRGMLGIGRKSEFAGLPYAVQFDRLSKGKDILMREQVWQRIFMAPSHSFDEVTITALQALGFVALTDGFGFFPYRMEGLTAVPQLISRPLPLSVGVETICLHVNSMSGEEIRSMVRFIRARHNKIISFQEAALIEEPIPGMSVALRYLSERALRLWRAMAA